MSELLTTAGKMSDADLQARVQELFKLYTDSVGAVITDLHELNPDALIVVATNTSPCRKSPTKRCIRSSAKRPKPSPA